MTLQEAISVLQSLVAEDDEVVVVWYLLGWALHLAEDYAPATEALLKVKFMTTENIVLLELLLKQEK